MLVYVCEPGWEAALREELVRVKPSAKIEVVSPGWLEAHPSSVEAESVKPVAFAFQCLPNAEATEAPSIRQWAAFCAPRIIEQLRGHDGAWRLHVFGVKVPGGTAGPRRCSLVREGILEIFRKKQRRLLRSLVEDPLAPWAEEEQLIQLGVRSAEKGYFSHASPSDRIHHGSTISRFPGGRVEIPEDRKAPARAYRKLREALLHANWSIEPGETVVDLGSSPGGWAYVALEAGAHVTAVDRSKLDSALMKHPRLEFVRGDAFKFAPLQPVDWLICDVIAFPNRIIELLDIWLSRGWCRRFCVTLKFRGTEDYPIMDRVTPILAARAKGTMLRRLENNKNEVTVVGERA
ncbi:MAG: SAM-dependent methyltransferase [Planctomycetota bacterium]